jgi:hypothetical protein
MLPYSVVLSVVFAAFCGFVAALGVGLRGGNTLRAFAFAFLVTGVAFMFLFGGFRG